MFSYMILGHFFSVSIFFAILVSLRTSDGVFESYSICSSPIPSCGNMLNIGYPFWGGGRPQYCGHPAMELSCGTEIPILSIARFDDYPVLGMSKSKSKLTIKMKFNRDCYSIINRSGLDVYDAHLFSYSRRTEKICLDNCTDNLTLAASSRYSIKCIWYDDHTMLYYQPNISASPMNCYIDVPVLKTELVRLDGGVISLEDVFSQGFEVEFDYTMCSLCEHSGGKCGSNYSDFVCFCKDGYFFDICRKSGIAKLKESWKIIIGLGILAIIIGLPIAVVCCIKNRNAKIRLSIFKKKKATSNLNVNTFIRISASYTLKRFSYASIRKMTDGFKEKLGEGGFATVYEGKLFDGQIVAVKMLRLAKGNGEDFINEVVSITRTNHVNIVALLGFCLENNKRALVYEYMENGSLEKFTYLNGSNQALPWETRLKIAIGIAKGLDYLHRGCNTQILHFDIKPHNILLDGVFCPKISDFGLARLCPQQEITVSTMEARGTIGYIAPEVFFRNQGGVTHKSDVYSFGMMVLDMVCGRKNVLADKQRSSQLYFPQWIYNRLEVDEEAAFPGTTDDEERALQKKMIVVSLWCIQTEPSKRPSMSRVIEMLQGCAESIEMPCLPDDQSSLPRLVSDTSSGTATHSECK